MTTMRADQLAKVVFEDVFMRMTPDQNEIYMLNVVQNMLNYNQDG